MNFEIKTVHWDKAYPATFRDTSKVRMRFATLEKLPAVTFRRHCAERLAIVMEMRKQDMLVKLTQGELPFTINPEECLSVQTLADRCDMYFDEVADHLRFLETSGIVRYYDSKVIEWTFFNDDSKSQAAPFAIFVPDVREMFSEMNTTAVAELVQDVMQHKLVLTCKRTFPMGHQLAC